MLHRGEADAMICGTIGSYRLLLADGERVGLWRVPRRRGERAAPLSGNAFIADTLRQRRSDRNSWRRSPDGRRKPCAAGIEPKVALLSHPASASDCLAARKMRKTLAGERAGAELEIDGEMHGDAALVESIRHDLMPDSPLKGSANLLIMPNIAARISYNLLRALARKVTVGPVLMGSLPVHILTPIASVRRIVNMVRWRWWKPTSRCKFGLRIGPRAAGVGGFLCLRAQRWRGYPAGGAATAADQLCAERAHLSPDRPGCRARRRRARFCSPHRSARRSSGNQQRLVGQRVQLMQRRGDLSSARCS